LAQAAAARGDLCTVEDMRVDGASEQNRAAEMGVEAKRFSAQILVPCTRLRTICHVGKVAL